MDYGAAAQLVGSYFETDESGDTVPEMSVDYQHVDELIILADGLCRQLCDVVSTISSIDDQGKQVKDLTQQLDGINRKLAHLVMSDPLTSLGNRRFFLDRAGIKLAEAERGRPFSIILIDVDNFKQFNDAYGHLAGDEALQQIADVFRKIVRKVDCVARYGGEEFVVASTVEVPGSLVLANKLRAAVADIKNQHRPLTVSVGVAQYQPLDTIAGMVLKADKALYKAKDAGKNRVASYDVET